MTEIAIVKNITIGTGYLHGKNAVILDVEIDDPEDMQTVEYFTPSGFSTLPQIGDQIIIHQISPEFKVATATNAGINIPTQNGESSIFSLDGSTVKASAKFLKNGEIMLNDGNGFAVEFLKLKTAFDLLVQNFNSHIHNLVPPVPPATMPVVSLAPAVQSTASIDDSKVEKVRL